MPVLELGLGLGERAADGLRTGVDVLTDMGAVLLGIGAEECGGIEENAVNDNVCASFVRSSSGVVERVNAEGSAGTSVRGSIC